MCTMSNRQLGNTGKRLCLHADMVFCLKAVPVSSVEALSTFKQFLSTLADADSLQRKRNQVLSVVGSDFYGKMTQIM